MSTNSDIFEECYDHWSHSFEYYFECRSLRCRVHRAKILITQAFNSLPIESIGSAKTDTNNVAAHAIQTHRLILLPLAIFQFQFRPQWIITNVTPWLIGCAYKKYFIYIFPFVTLRNGICFKFMRTIVHVQPQFRIRLNVIAQFNRRKLTQCFYRIEWKENCMLPGR